MKYALTLASALAAVAMAAKPEFLNNNFDVVQGEPFTLQFSGCETGCTITLQTGDENNLQDVKELSSSASGGSLTVTLDDVPTGSYNFKIKNNASGEENYSLVFNYDGTPASTTAASTTAPETTATPTSTTEAETTTTPSTMSTSTVSSASSSASETPSSTASEEPSSTRGGSAPTTPPDSAAGRLGSPAGLALGAVGAMVLFA